MAHEFFEEAVALAFSYLVERYGFERRPLQSIAYERLVQFNRPDVKVIVQQEMGSAPFVTVATCKAIDAHMRREFGLPELEHEMAKLGRYAYAPAAPVTLQESINELARVLEQIGADVLRGDFTVLLERERRHLDALGKSS